MTWLIRGARTPLILFLTALAGLLAGALRGRSAPVPSLTQATLAPAPVVAVLALLPSVLILWGWSGIPWSSLARPARRPLPLLLALPSAAITVYVAAAGLGGGSGALAENARDALGLLGLTLIGLRLFDERGGLIVPIGYLLAAFLLGRPAGAAYARHWAWILNDAGSLVDVTAALALAGVGLVVLPRLPATLLR